MAFVYTPVTIDANGNITDLMPAGTVFRYAGVLLANTQSLTGIGGLHATTSSIKYGIDTGALTYVNPADAGTITNSTPDGVLEIQSGQADVTEPDVPPPPPTNGGSETSNMTQTVLRDTNINFVAGKRYRIGSATGAIIMVVNAVSMDTPSGDNINAQITAGNFTLVSGTVAASSYGQMIYIETTTTGLSGILTTLVAKVSSVIARVVGKVNTHTTQIGTLNQQMSDVNTSLAGKAEIDDTSTGTTKGWSASKIISAIATAKDTVQSYADQAAQNAANALETKLTGLAPEIMNSFQEVYAWTQEKGSEVAALFAALGNKLSLSGDQTLTAEQKAFVRTNVDVYSKSEADSMADTKISTALGDSSAIAAAADDILSSIPALT